ncbi:hypothetical protein CERZMDRAFT_99057 [Cercospora zeae-maydis SCOH1-5]|uniref:Uncharacterized protein n=1 Tax=Cercospora zeae-maydis SCOH1-5 TaxID=717836 RepID=A0A6A6FBP0_9PEZI|nr:hypothetical protein CERZMDRAFT_99057 [Cercospora zeae-maydis SCOH1-5]
MSLQYISDCSANAITYLTRLLRSIQISRHNFQVAKNGGPSLMCLPDDILLLILDHTVAGAGSNGRLSSVATAAGTQDLVRLATCNRRMLTLASPLLFEKIRLGRSWGPEHMIDSLKALRQSPDALKAARELHVDLWSEPECTVPSQLLDELGSILIECMTSTNRLERISVSTTPSCSESLRETFKRSGCTFPQVKELVVGPHLGWLVRLCPNLERISSDDWLIESVCGQSPLPEFLRAAGQATELREFSCNACWDAGSLELAHQSMPQLRSLGICGRVGPALRDIITLLRKFRHLRFLVLPEVSMLAGLNVGNRPYARFSDSGTTATQASALVTIFQKLPRLEEVSLGRHLRAWARSEVDLHGQIILRWETSSGLDHPQDPYYNQHIMKLETDDSCSLHPIEDDLEAILSTAEDSASIFSRADTLAF